MEISKNVTVTRSIANLVTDKFHVVVIDNTFSLLPLGRYLFPCASLNRYPPRCSNKLFSFLDILLLYLEIFLFIATSSGNISFYCYFISEYTYLRYIYLEYTFLRRHKMYITFSLYHCPVKITIQ